MRNNLITVERNEELFQAFIGALAHQIDVYTAFGSYDSPGALHCTRRSSLAEYISVHASHLLPASDPYTSAGNTVNGLSTLFAVNYHNSPSFKSDYLFWLYSVINDGQQ